MDEVSDTCKYHSEYFATIFQVRIVRGHLVKKVKVLNFGTLVVQCVFIGQIFAKTRNIARPQTPLKRQNRS